MKALPWRLAIGCCVALALQPHSRPAETPPPDPPTVGELGDVRRLRFEGVAAFPVQDLRNALRQNIDFLLASHPAAPFLEYKAVLERALVAGYLNGGFPGANVSTAVDGKNDEVLVPVREGHRYLAGAVVVSGAKTLDTEALIRRLTEPLSSRVAPAQQVKTEDAESREEPEVRRTR